MINMDQNTDKYNCIDCRLEKRSKQDFSVAVYKLGPSSLSHIFLWDAAQNVLTCIHLYVCGICLHESLYLWWTGDLQYPVLSWVSCILAPTEPSDTSGYKVRLWIDGVYILIYRDVYGYVHVYGYIFKAPFLANQFIFFSFRVPLLWVLHFHSLLGHIGQSHCSCYW